jgi:hypothetical protein
MLALLAVLRHAENDGTALQQGRKHYSSRISRAMME